MIIFHILVFIAEDLTENANEDSKTFATLY